MLSDVVFILLINVKMPTMSMVNFMLSRIEHENFFIISRPGFLANKWLIWIHTVYNAAYVLLDGLVDMITCFLHMLRIASDGIF